MDKVTQPSLDHLRIFTAVVDCGSFSAAARQVEKSQPAVSYAITAIEAQLGLTLFERGKRRPMLTAAGLAILSYARRMCQLADELAANAASLTAGLEGNLIVAVDTFFPSRPLGAALSSLANAYPAVTVDLRIASREVVFQQVMEGPAAIGVSAFDIAWPAGLEAHDFGSVEIFGVVAPSHPLASHSGPIPTMVLRDYLQITNRAVGTGDEARDISVNSARVWRVSGLDAQLELLRQGIGWGYLPSHLANAEIALGRLVALLPASRRRGVQPWSLIYRAAKPPGPAARHLSQSLRDQLHNQES